MVTYEFSNQCQTSALCKAVLRCYQLGKGCLFQQEYYIPIAYNIIKNQGQISISSVYGPRSMKFVLVYSKMGIGSIIHNRNVVFHTKFNKHFSNQNIHRFLVCL